MTGNKLYTLIREKLNLENECIATYTTNFAECTEIRFNDISIINKINKIIASLEWFTGEKIEAVPMPGGVIRFDFKKENQETVNFCDHIGNVDDGSILFGADEDMKTVSMPIDAMPHLLISGTTGSGKSVLMHSVILSSMMKCKDSLYILIDPKQIEFNIYNGVDGLYDGRAITDTAEAIDVLKKVSLYMDSRYAGMALGLTYNTKIFIVIDELADLMMTSKKSVENYLVRIAQKGRAAGIHLICATQRPMASVLTGLLKSNIPTKVALKTASAVDSVSVLGHKGAEKLLGKGDAILQRPDSFEEIHFKAPYLDAETMSNYLSEIKKS